MHRLVSLERIYRIGQKSNVFIYRLITKNTIEEKVLALQQKKSEIAKNIFDGLSAEKLSAKDLMTLLG
ncbi:MAG: hypothetical protein IKO57_07075 [Treponema sp.]|nr:hypothetical protein [Treponema sp.]